MYLTVVYLVVRLFVLAAFFNEGLAQQTFCFNEQFFRCNIAGTLVDTLASGEECCNSGHLVYRVDGTDTCQVCPENVVCHSGSECGLFPGVGIGSIHDCCVVNPQGNTYIDISGTCRSCSMNNFICHPRVGCDGEIAELSGPANSSLLSSCCDGPGVSYTFRSQCYSCTVFGWVSEAVEGPESATDYSLSLGYIKGGTNAVNVTIEVINGTAVPGQDFSLSLNEVTIPPNSSTTLSVTFTEDRLAQESQVEVATLGFVLPPDSLPTNAVIRERVGFAIMDTDELVIGFAEDSFTENEMDGSISMVLTKNLRIASPVTIQIQSFTVSGAMAAGITLPPNIPMDDIFSPNKASDSPEDRRDFSTDPFNVTFPADEVGDEVTNITISVPIVDDTIDEAPVEVFVTTYTVIDSIGAVGSTRSSTLSRIMDDDDIRIGFQQAAYTFSESAPEEQTEILLEKENGQITEQTYFVLVNVSAATTNTATLNEDYTLSAPPDLIVLTFPPDNQTISFPFMLIDDTLPELNEGLVLTSASSSFFSEFLPPITLFVSTMSEIEDNDPLQVGFVSNYIVEENVGMFNACVRVLNVDDSQPLPFTIPLLVTSVSGSANESDYVPVGPDLPLLLDSERRRDCFPIQIIDEFVFEQSETFTLSISLDMSRNYTMRDILDVFLPTNVTILANDDMCPDLEPPKNGSISYSPDRPGPFTDVGSVVTYSCDEGFELVGDPMRTCLSGTEYSGDAPTCEPLCPDLDLLVNGMISYSPDTTGPFRDIGTIANHSCNEGFFLVGVEARECLDGGVFDEMAPTCEPLCPDLDLLVNGMISYSPDTTGPFRDIGTIANHSCNEGFFLVGVEARECLDGGVFDEMAPTCEPLCPDLDLLVNGMISYSPDMTGPFRDIGTIATHSCDEGFFLMGAATRECLDGGVFNGTAPTCEALCPDLDPVVNGTISYSSDMTGPFRDIGTIATHSCNDGFFLMGAATRECLDGGVFSGTAPTCEALCPDLDPVVNGMISYSPDMTGPFRDIGTIATHSCNDGFSLMGAATRECVSGGVFDGTPPTCEGLCVDLEPLANGTISYSPDMTGPFRDIGTIATHSCDEGFFLMGAATRECLDGGVFNGTAPTCEALCPDLDLLINGTISYSSDMTGPFRDIGTIATHSCDEGFSLMGAAMRECLDGGIFSGTAPTCEPLCPDLAPLTDGGISYSPDMNGPFRDNETVATHSCDDGFVLIGEATRVCLNGVFDGSEPTCDAIQCPSLPPLVNGMLTYDREEAPRYDIGTVVTYECNVGFALVGDENRTCTGGDGSSTDGPWTGDAPLCEALCPDLAPLANGVISYSPDMDGAFRDVGTIATHSCNNGFMLVGNVTRVCLDGGVFNGSEPTCEPRICPVLPNILNGMIAYNPDVEPPEVGTVATYTCNLGFVLTGGSGVRVCQENSMFSGVEPSCQQVDIRRVNDTAAGDPVMTVPLYITNTSALPQIGEDDLFNLCFEVHGEDGEYFNLVSDTCASVNAHYARVDPRLDFNVISEIVILAPDLTPACHNINVSANGCQASVDGIVLDSMYASAGISVRLYRNRVRITIPNCQNIDLVMWVFCEEDRFRGDPDFGEPDVTISVPAIRFVIARGFNIRESAHGILGQFWNVPIEVERYTGVLSDGNTRENAYIMTVNYPGQNSRRFLSILDAPIWDAKSGGYCLYAGNRQGGSILELLSPNDPVIEGWYTDYIVEEAFGFQFNYSHFDPLECGG